MGEHKTPGGRPTKAEGPKLSRPEEVERLLVEGEVVVGSNGEAARVWLTQREIATRFGVAPSLIADFARKHCTTERRAAFQAMLDAGESPPLVEKEPGGPAEHASTEAPPPAATERRRPGRPRRQDAPVINFEELDRLLVFGEVEVLGDGTTRTVYPLYRTLAEKYGVVPSVIADYAKSHNTMKRRKLAAMRIETRTDEKIVELRSDALAFGEARLVAMIDDFFVRFEGALKEGRVRTDSPADVNTLARLKHFVLGGADSRHEVRNLLSLEALQERYARSMRETDGATRAMGGVIDVRVSPEVREAEGSNARSSGPHPPLLSFDDADVEPKLADHEKLSTREDEK